MLYQEFLKEEILDITKILLNKKKIDPSFLKTIQFNIEVSQKKEFGDLSCNIAMVFCKFFKLSPNKLAEEIVYILNSKEYILKIEIANPGFINIFFQDSFWHTQLIKFMKLNGNYDYKIKKKKVCIEYVSANPTGLMHIGHARGAVLGDTLASILEEVGFDVTREYYINDAGEQIKTLIETFAFHIEKKCNKSDIVIPEKLYPGQYLNDLAKKLAKEHSIKSPVDTGKFKKVIINRILNDIKNDLKSLKVSHDVFVSEEKISSKKNINNLKSELVKLNLAYTGFQERPKNLVGKKWEPKEQFLFKSKKFGDDSDRALIKPNGEITYFMSDILYHQNKIERNFHILINIWGVDHFGYVKRLKNALAAINKKRKYEIEIKLTSLVNLIKNGSKLKMSKREGNYITLREVINSVGVDALRFMMISRNAEKTIDFDFDLLLKKNKDNQVFYVQYAFARCMSILNISSDKLEKIDKDKINLKLLVLNEEKMIIKLICSFYNIVRCAAENYEPHRITNFLYDISKIFHNYWGLGNVDKTKRIITSNEILTLSRLFLIKAVSFTLKKGLEILKINAPENM